MSRRRTQAVPGLRKSLGVAELTGFAVTGLFMWLFCAPALRRELGDSALYVWMIAAAAGVFFNLQLKKLSDRWPELTGGTGSYAAKLWEDHPRVGTFAALSYVAGWAAVPALTAAQMARWVAGAFAEAGVHVPPTLIAAALCATVFLLALAGLRALALIHLLIAVPSLLALLALVGWGMVFVFPGAPAVHLPVEPQPTWQLLAWYVIAAFTASGVDTVVAFTPEAKNPSHAGRLVRLAGLLILPITIAGTWLMVNASPSAHSDPLEVMTALARPFWGNASSAVVGFVFIAGSFAAATMACTVAPRTIVQLARNGALPKSFAEPGRKGVPVRAVVLTAVASVAFFVMEERLALFSSGIAMAGCVLIVRLGVARDRKTQTRWRIMSGLVGGAEAMAIAAAAFVFGGVAFGTALLLGVALLGLAWLVARIHARRSGASSRRKLDLDRQYGDGEVNRHIVMFTLMIVTTATLAWWVGRATSGVSLVDRGGVILAAMILVAALAATAASAWTTVPQITNIVEAHGHASHLFNRALDAQIVTDQDGIIRRVNPAAELLLGQNSQALTGRKLSMLFEGLNENPAEWRSRVELRPIAEDDEDTLLVEASVSPGLYGEEPVYLVILRDVTARKQTEQALAAARDAALANARLKTDFVANVSHEIRTPMNGVIGMTGLLLETRLSAEQREYAQTVRQSAEALLTIVNDILDFSKVEAGMMKIESVEFRLDEAVSESVQLLGATARKKGVDLETWCTPDTMRLVSGDDGRIRQVLLNLVSNAIKFTSRGYVLVKAELEQDGPVPMFRFSVEDTGIGIDPTKLGHVFEKFAQADLSTTRKYGGTGLGLAISKKLVELMGGEIGVDSRPGKGSMFWFTLPLQTVGEQNELAADGVQDLRVLVVEPKPLNQRLIATQLHAWSLRHTTVGTAEQALLELRKASDAGSPYGVALIEVDLPDGSGEELGRAIAADTALASPVLVSMGARSPDEGKLRSMGFAAALTKPLRASRLFDTLMLALSNQGGPMRRPPATPKDTAPTAWLAGRRALVVDDNPVNQKVASKTLERLGCATDVAGNGLEALELIDGVPYDFVLMDCEMPEMDGFAATRELRRREAGKSHVPVIAMTAHALRGAKEACLAAGMDDYVSKPVRPKDLDEVIRRTLQQGPSEHTGPILDATVIEDLQAMVGDDPSFLAELTEAFAASSASALQTLRAAKACGDSAAFSRAAHMLKGAGANVGAARVAELCSAAEQNGVADVATMDLAVASALQALRSLATKRAA